MLRDVMARCTGLGWAVTGLQTAQVTGVVPAVRVRLAVQGRGSATALAAALGE